MARQESFTLKGKVEFDSKDAEQNVKGLNKGVNKTNKSTSKLSQGASKLKGKLDSVTGGAVTGFQKMAKSIGGANKGFKAMKIAIAATGVGLLVIAVVALVQAFKRSEEGQDKLNRIMTIAGAVVDNLLDVFANLGEVIIDAVTNPKKAWDKLTKALGDGWKFIKKAVIIPLVAGFENFALNFKKNIKKARIAWNEFTGDSEEAEKLKGELDDINEKIKENEKKIREGAEEVIKFYGKASGAVEEFIDKQKEEVKQADEVAKKRNKADKLERKLIVQKAESQRKIAQLRLKAEKEGEFTAEQRKQFLIEANNIQKELTEKEVKAAKLREEAQRIENSLNKSTKEDKKKLAELEAARIGKENESFRLQRQLAARLKTINSQIESEEEKKQKKKAKRQKAIADIEQSLAEETANKQISEEQKKLNKWRVTQIKKLEELEGYEKEQNRLKEQIETEFKERKKEIEKQEKKKEAEKRIEELEAKRGKDFENAEAEFQFLKAQKERIKNMEVLTEKQKAEQLMKVNNQLAEAKEEKSKVSTKIAKIQNSEEYAAAKSTLQGIGKLIGEQAKANKLIGGAEALINTFKGVSEVWSSKSVLPEPFGTAQKVVATGTTLASGLKAVQKINSTSIPNVPGGSGGGTPTASGGIGGASAGQASAPDFNIVGQSQGNQIADAIGNQKQNMRAYVVGSEVSNQQELDRQIEEPSRLG